MNEAQKKKAVEMAKKYLSDLTKRRRSYFADLMGIQFRKTYQAMMETVWLDGYFAGLETLVEMGEEVEKMKREMDK